MTVLRQEFQISVEGADAAAAALGRTAAAMNSTGQAADPASTKLNKLGREMTGAAASADNAAKSTSLASRAMTMLRQAAELIPGMELGTIFAFAATGVALLASKMFGAADAAGNLAKSSRTLTAQLVADAMKIKSVTDGLDRYAKSVGAASGKRLTFMQEQDALRKIASGEIITEEGTRKKAEDTAATLRRFTELRDNARRDPTYATDVIAAGGMGAIDAKIKELEARQAEIDRAELSLSGQAGGGDPWVTQAKAFGSGLVSRLRIAGESTADQLRRDVQTYGVILDSQFELAQRKQEEAERKAKNGARAAAAAAKAARFDPLAPLGDRALPDLRAQNTSDLLKKAGEWMDAPGSTRSNIPGGPGWGLKPDGTADTAPVLKLASAWNYLGESMSGTVGRMAQSASDIGSIVTQSVGALTGALGAAATNMIIAGDAGGKALKKQAGNALAGISAQAFGYATLLTAFGIAAAIPGVGTIMGLAAPGFFAAAGVMAGAGAALGVGARMLGADKIGAGSGAGNAASSGTSAPVGAGSSGPGMAGQTTPLELHVYMGGDEVHDLTYRTARRREMSGSMSMPRVGAAA